jgi:hypothetical protein
MLLLVAPWGLRAGGLWLGMLLGGTLLAEPGPPTFWAATIAALVMTVVFAMTGRPIWPSTSAGQRLRYYAVGFGLAVGGLGTAVVLLDGVTLQPSTPLQQVLSLAVLALLLTPAQAGFPSARSSLVVQLVLVAPVVWLLSWLSRWLASPLAVVGIADLMLTALIVAVFTIPGRWMQRRLWRRPLPDLTPLEHRMFGPIP